MKDLADADIVFAILKRQDHLEARAQEDLRRHALALPLSAGIEILLVAKKHGISYRRVIVEAAKHFDLEQRDVLAAAARALDKGEIKTVFDAVHASCALLRGVRLHTTDKALIASRFPTSAF